MTYYHKVLDDEKTKLLEYLDEKGILAKLYRYGIITQKPKVSIECRLRVKALMNQGLTKNQACRRVGDNLGIHYKTVYNYLR